MPAGLVGCLLYSLWREGACVAFCIIHCCHFTFPRHAAHTQPPPPLLGVLYEATMVPSPTTLAIVNISGTEAKVECLLSEFIQLR